MSLALTSFDLPFGNSFASLPDAFYTRLEPTPLPSPYLLAVSPAAAAMVGLDAARFEQEEMLALFTGNARAPSSQPLAAVYSGHQFGVFAGQLGDGRAILLGDLPAPGLPQPSVMELQLKGSGMTPYSRMGDGRAVLRSSIREFLCSEAMAALGIPTTRALCITGSGKIVRREILESAAVVTRMAPTFIRFGSFEHWYYSNHHELLKTLADYVIDRFYPELRESKQPYQALLTEVTRRTAHLIAHWQTVGFMHGVMNSDNMSILGQTIDYGPFGFMEAYDIRHICNHSDTQGRYSYAMQPRMGHWNCYALGQAMLPLLDNEEAVHESLSVYQTEFTGKMNALMHAKLGLQSDQEDDAKLFDDLAVIMQGSHVDFTLFYRRLCDMKRDDPAQDEPVRDLFIDRAAFDAWAVKYRARLASENSDDNARRTAMRAVNPKYILRNYLAQVAIEKAQNKDFSEVRKLLSVLEKPYDDQPENETYAALPPDWASRLEVSCSS